MSAFRLWMDGWIGCSFAFGFCSCIFASALYAMSPIGSSLTDGWVHPGNVLVLLMLIGPDIIQISLAQLSGCVFTPVAFSFGWVAYSFKNLSLVFSQNKLVPEPDFSSIVINGQTGYTRDNHSWVLSRILRDFDYWKPEPIENRLREVLTEATNRDTEKARQDGRDPPPPREQAGLCVSIFRTSPGREAGVPVTDWLYYSGIVVAIIQLGISVIPSAVHNEWAILVVTGSGILLAFATGALPQWKMEKWGHIRTPNKTVILTRGNGAQHALVIVGDENFLDLEKLAVSGPKGSLLTRFCTVPLALLWIAHLFTVLGIKEDPWFLLAIGGIGMLHSVVVAGLPRRPEALGLHLDFEACIAQPKVMLTLKEVERRYPNIGASMLSTFFPGRLRREEEMWWNATPHERTLQELWDACDL
ncbi:hypothetical protein M378DRAFT_184426 [Amanita muscaria Koide BX008]|uniref:Uncharacterized protein n=1 Tax=Amanita muscaria (strain Koide BX008) TaxID=946122 RepID=A0A0C2T094_AMAMK|nr:hypothetical protein M378DRAFT_184426 [Amanita muscaria Koide BX008]